MIKKIVPFLLVALCMPSISRAENWGWTDSTIGFQKCNSHTLTGTDSCIGISANLNCAPNKAYGRYGFANGDEYMIQMLVARKYTDGGIYVCPTQIEARNSDNDDKAWIAYADLSAGDASRCTWLCKEGHTGENCLQQESEIDSCDITLLKRENYSSIKQLRNGADITFPEFSSENVKDDSCSKSNKQEHVRLVMITNWTASGHGAFARVMIIRAETQTANRKITSFPWIYPASGSTEKLLCKNGYKPNATNTDCVAIDSNICNAQQLCDGWDGFDENIHRFYVPTMAASLSTSNLTVGTKSPTQKTLCYQYRCLEAGTAFVSSSNRSCAPCVNDARDGVSPADGTCIKCGLGQIFDETALSSGYCATADAYSKTDMMYGKGKTKSNVPNIKNQCWTMVDLQDYLNCVKGILTGGNILQVDSQRRTTSASQELLNNLSNINLFNKQ